MTPKKAGLWEEAVGFVPHKVVVYENAEKGNVLYLRWRAGGNWKKRSLGVQLKDDKGRVLAHVKQMARDEAARQYEILTGRRLSPIEAAGRPLTLGDTWAVISDEKTGCYPVDTPHRREVARAMKAAVRILGAELPWDVIDRARIRMLARARVDEIRSDVGEDGKAKRAGYRGAEVTVIRFLTVAAWLRDENRISAAAAMTPRAWRDELRKYWRESTGSTSDPEPSRPRHTIEEMRKILAAAAKVDPRLALLLALGAELRLGQVRRCRRSDLDLTAGTLTVRSSGKKKGSLVRLTGGQLAVARAAIGPGGYLERLEKELPDYSLFPSGQMPGSKKQKGAGIADPSRHGGAPPVDGTAWRGWFRDAEALAEVPHISGRAAYGLRRVAVDEAKRLKISREGLQKMGGWTDNQMPDMVYADQEAIPAQDEAKDIRAKIRGESE